MQMPKSTDFHPASDPPLVPKDPFQRQRISFSGSISSKNALNDEQDREPMHEVLDESTISTTARVASSQSTSESLPTTVSSTTLFSLLSSSSNAAAAETTTTKATTTRVATKTTTASTEALADLTDNTIKDSFLLRARVVEDFARRIRKDDDKSEVESLHYFFKLPLLLCYVLDFFLADIQIGTRFGLVAVISGAVGLLVFMALLLILVMALAR